MQEIYDDFFKKEILQNLNILEKKRIKKLISTLALACTYFVIGIIFAYSFFRYNYANPIILTIFLLGMNFFIINALTVITYNNRNFQTELYKEILPLFLKPVANFVLWPKNQNTESILKSGIFRSFDTQDDESCYFGHYNKTNIVISKTELRLPSNGLENRNIFKGTIIQLELTKNTTQNVIICSKNETVPSKLNKTLQQNFVIHCNNPELTNPKIYKALAEITLLYLADGIFYSSQNNTIIIALREKQKNRIGNLFKSVKNQKNYDKLTQKFIAIFNLVDLLNN